MKNESNRASIDALKNLLSEVDQILSTTTPLPENRTPRCRELLTAALALADDLTKQGEESAAVALGCKGQNMEQSLEQTLAEYAFQRDQQEFNLGDTLDIKTGLILAALTFLAIQSGEFLKPGITVYEAFVQTFSVPALALGGIFVIWELIPRKYDRDRTPEEYISWIEQKKAAGHTESEMPNIVANLRLKLVNQRIATNLAINKTKSWAMDRAFLCTMVAFGLNLLTLALHLFKFNVC
jgi:hypothetical protein